MIIYITSELHAITLYTYNILFVPSIGNKNVKIGHVNDHHTIINVVFHKTKLTKKSKCLHAADNIFSAYMIYVIPVFHII